VARLEVESTRNRSNQTNRPDIERPKSSSNAMNGALD
jgi:hypothetical protein